MAKTKTKKQITVTIDLKLAERLLAVSKEEAETFSDIVNDCLKLGEGEYLLYKKMKENYLVKILKKREEELKKLNKTSVEDSPTKDSPQVEAVANTQGVQDED